MEIKVQHGVVNLKITSEDLSNPTGTFAALEELIQEEGYRSYIADLSRLAMINSLQAGTLVSLHLLCYENLGVLRLAHVPRRVRAVLQLIGLDKIMEIHHGREVAGTSFEGEQTEPLQPPPRRSRRQPGSYDKR